MKLVELNTLGRGKFKFGTAHGDPDPVVHSDTIFSALCRNYRTLYGNGKLEDLLEAVISGDFRISSGFHSLHVFSGSVGDGKEEKLYFLPRPRMKFELKETSREEVKRNPKLLEGIRYLSLKVLEKLAGGKKLEVCEELVIDESYLIDRGDLARLGLKSSDTGKGLSSQLKLFELEDEQKVVVDRAGGESDTFLSSKFKAQTSSCHVDGVDYFLTPSIYFLVNLGNSLPEGRVEAAIRLIADQGLGGDRSTGNGLFEGVQITEAERFADLLVDREAAGSWMSLSLLFPDQGDFEEVDSYSLIERTSYIESPEAGGKVSEKIRFLEEGAVCRSRIEGSIEEVSPEGFSERHHPVYRYGRGLYCSLDTT